MFRLPISVTANRGLKVLRWISVWTSTTSQPWRQVQIAGHERGWVAGLLVYRHVHSVWPAVILKKRQYSTHRAWHLEYLYTTIKNIHSEMILDVGIGEKRKETRFLIWESVNQIPTLTLGNLLLYIPTSENRLSDVGYVQ